MTADRMYAIFKKCITDYHQSDDVNAPLQNPHQENNFEAILYNKCWIDTVQWHLEDIIRNPGIQAEEALKIKRRIDKSNQERTDLVEKIDDHFLSEFGTKELKEDARLNTESPAWAVDRLSILALKIYHMQIETERKEIDEDMKDRNTARLNLLLTQKQDLILAINQLLEDLAEGYRIMKVYRQVKMYNDPKLNPVLYSQNKA